MKKIKRSPFFYVGDKYKLIEEIREYFPQNIGRFIEPFVGGGSVFLNTRALTYYVNDIDTNVYNLHNFLSTYKDLDRFLVDVQVASKKYNLSRSFVEDIVPFSLKRKHNKTYYSKFNKLGYEQLRADYNRSKTNDFFSLYLLLIYGFNRMIRFNKKGEFNVPVGNVDFNTNVVKALSDYFDFCRDNNIFFSNTDYRDFINNFSFVDNDFVYLDPPYLITYSEYNKIWNETDEYDLINTLDELNAKGVKFAVSNVTTYKGRKNNIFYDWMQEYNCVNIKSNYISYHDNSKKSIEEVLVFNY